MTFVDEEVIVLSWFSIEWLHICGKIAAQLGKISNLKVVLCEVYIDKLNPQAAITCWTK
jgi:pyrimidine operon attenuation protein/uracil phosphoribosyltransferase